MRECRCGCGEAVKGSRVFVNKEHQLDWMVRGGAAEIGALQPIDAKALGGKITGEQAFKSGRLLVASKKGAARAKEIAIAFRASRRDTKK